MSFRETMNFWKSNIKFVAWAIGGLLAIGIATTNHFVLASDHEVFKQKVEVQNITTEESMVMMQIMMQEDRLRNATKENDMSESEIIKGRLNFLRTRASVLEKLRLEKK